MFRTLNSRTLILLVCVLFICNSGLSGQVPEHEVPELRQQAIMQFEKGDYASAGEAFAQLIQQFPRDAMYRYYAGICTLEQGRDLEDAVELLYYASTRGVPADVYYYLGEAYRKMYDFERAKKYYILFDKEAPRSMSRAYDSKLLIRSVNTAMQITSRYNPFEVQNVTFINLYDPEQIGQIRMKGGDMSRKPEPFFSENEARDDLNAWMFMPKTLSRGQKVYFAGLERNGRDGFQIMQARRGNTGNWTDIKSIDALNTERDEILPYFDPVGKDLYFASDGREGLGGFDLFRSHYDEERDEWSEPVSLGFPVNSAYDDYLLLPGTDLGMVTFFSARQISDTSVAVYRVHLKEPKQSLASKDPKEIRQIANLGEVASEMMKEFEAYKEFLADSKDDIVPGDSPSAGRDAMLVSGSPASEGPGKKPAAPASASVRSGNAPSAPASARSGNVGAAATGRGLANEASDPDYQELISNALQHQAATDSLTELATAARIRVRESDDPNEKWLSQRQIMVWEKKASMEQVQADTYFSQVAEYRRKATPEVIEKDTVINDITVYQFTDTEAGIADQPDRTAMEEKAKKAFGGDDRQMSQALTVPSSQKDTEVPVQMEQKVQVGQHIEKSANGSGESLHQPGGPMQNKHPEPAAMNPEPGQQFEIRSASPYSVSNPIPVNVPLPGGTCYRIQMGVFSTEVEPATYGGIVPIHAIKDAVRNLVFYYAGQFRTYDEARDALTLVRSEGFSDAFIVAWYNGAKMSIEKARKLEQ